MKSSLLYSFLIGSFFLISGCSGNKDMEEDASNIADAMCRSIEVMNNLKIVNPEDTIRINDLQLTYQGLQAEMETLYAEFRKKYESRLKDPQFNDNFSKELRKAILNCRFLSKEDRERYEKELEE